MSNKWRRFEILLPQQFNDGRDVSDELLGHALDEVIEEFGAVSFEPTGIAGFWIHQGIAFHDSLSKIVVDAEESDDNRQWMRDFKRRWMSRLEQIDLWLVSYEIEVE